MTDRIPPHNDEAEKSVLGSILLSKEAFYEVQEHIKEDDFYNDMHKEIYNAAIELHRRNEPIDVLTVSEELKKRKSLEMVGGRAYIASLSNSVPSTSNAGQYAKIIAEKAVLRRLITTASDIIEESYSASKDSEEVLDAAEKSIFEIAQDKQRKDFIPISDILEENRRAIEVLAESDSDLIGVPTGFRDVDKKLLGLQKADLIIVAARPSMGKTSFALNMALGAAEKGDASVLIFSLEMGKEQLGQRFISMESNLELTKIRDGSAFNNTTDRDAFNEGIVSLANKKIYIDDTSGVTPMEIKNKCRRLKAEKGLDLIIIDYLQLMTLGTKVESRQQEITAITRMLKELAKEMNCPVVVLSQLSRAVEQRGGIKRPMLSDLRESGAIEQDADIVMFLYREDYYDRETQNSNICDVIIAKNRNGEIGDVRLTWVSRYTKFGDYTMREEDYLYASSAPMEEPYSGDEPF